MDQTQDQGIAQPEGTPSADVVAANAPAPGSQVPPQASGDATPAQPQVGQSAQQSAPDEDWKARFDGLMSKFNQLQEQAEAERTEREAREAELRELRKAGMSPEEREKATLEELREYTQQLEAQVLNSQIENARTEALRRHPRIAPFADLLYADDPQELESLAQDLDARIAQLSPGQQTPEQFQAQGSNPPVQQQAPAPQQPAPTQVLPGSPGYQGGSDEDWKQRARQEIAAGRRGAIAGVLNTLVAKGKVIQEDDN